MASRTTEQTYWLIGFPEKRKNYTFVFLFFFRFHMTMSMVFPSIEIDFLVNINPLQPSHHISQCFSSMKEVKDYIILRKLGHVLTVRQCPEGTFVRLNVIFILWKYSQEENTEREWKGSSRRWRVNYEIFQITCFEWQKENGKFGRIS